jgi:uncharacterized membrane protein
MERRVALFLTSAAVLWAAAILFSPLAHRHPSAQVVARTIGAAGAVVCHQQAERSFAIANRPLPVCARCTGLYVSGAAGALAAWMAVPLMPRRTRALVFAAAVPTLATVAIEWAGLAQPANTARAVAALPLGAVCGWVFVRMLRAEGAPATWAMIS